MLTAIQQVEHNLVGVRILSREAKVWAEDVRISRQATQIALNEYQAGTQAFTTVVTAQEQQLAVEESLLSTQAQIQTDAVNLVVALGGGWSQSKLPDAAADSAPAYLETDRWPDPGGEALCSFLRAPASPWGAWIILAPVLGAIVVAFLVKTFAPEAKGHGVPEVMDAIYHQDGRIRPIVAVIKSLASAVSIGSGGSVGREGPIIQIGAAFGSTLGQLIAMPARQRAMLIAAGAGGGIAATFNTPLGGIVFAVAAPNGRGAAPFGVQKPGAGPTASAETSRPSLLSLREGSLIGMLVLLSAQQDLDGRGAGSRTDHWVEVGTASVFCAVSLIDRVIDGAFGRFEQDLLRHPRGR